MIYLDDTLQICIRDIKSGFDLDKYIIIYDSIYYYNLFISQSEKIHLLLLLFSRKETYFLKNILKFSSQERIEDLHQYSLIGYLMRDEVAIETCSLIQTFYLCINNSNILIILLAQLLLSPRRQLIIFCLYLISIYIVRVKVVEYFRACEQDLFSRCWFLDIGMTYLEYCQNILVLNIEE